MFCPFTREDCRTDCMLFSTLDGECRVALDSSVGRRLYARVHESAQSRYELNGHTAHPTWRDGSIVIPGQVAISLRGPKRIVSIENSEHGWRLFDESGYIIDESDKYADHPVRMGEPCDFWPETDEEMSSDGE